MAVHDAEAALAHELKTPLSVIVGYARLLEARGDDRTRAEACARIIEASERLEDAVDDVLALLRPRNNGASERAQARRSILVVDDDPMVRGLLVATLDDTEYDVTEATDGEHALALADLPAALAILDWRMPGRPGAEVLAALKERRPELPVIVLTADGQASERARALSLGADVFLTKPFSPLRLLALVEELLARAAA